MKKLLLPAELLRFKLSELIKFENISDSDDTFSRLESLKDEIKREMNLQKRFQMKL